MYNKAHGGISYQTYGPLQAATGQYSTTYPRSPGYIPGMPTIERVSIESGDCSEPRTVDLSKIPDIAALGAGDYGSYVAGGGSGNGLTLWAMDVINAFLRGQAINYAKLPNKNKERYDNNYTYNLQRDIINTIINDQNTGTQTGVSDFMLGLSKMQQTGCEVIAVNNVMVLNGMDASLAELTLQFETMNALTKVAFVREGDFGSNPYSIGRILEANEVGYSVVDIEQMANNSGTYIMSVWNRDNEDNLTVFEGLHTVALTVDNEKITIYNYYGREEIEKFDPEKFSEQFTEAFITGYKIK